MQKRALAIVVATIALALTGLACGGSEPEPSVPTATPTIERSPTKPTGTPTPTRTATLGPSATPEGTNTPWPTYTPYYTPYPTYTPLPSPTATPGPTATPTNVPEATNTPIPTNTLEPTNTPRPTQTPEPTEVQGLIIDTSRVVGSPVLEVEELVGNPTEILAMGIGEVEEIPDGGESRTYQVGKYTVYVNYDKSGIAKGLQVVDGLLEDGYSLDEWPTILSRLRVGHPGFPDVEAAGARRWTNASGYSIMMASMRPDGEIWTVRIYKISR